jgi:hypothetical protein
MRKALITLAAAAVAVGAMTAPALAAPRTAAPKATLVASPEVVTAGSTVMLSGCGYTAGKQVNITITDSQSQMFYPTGVDATGCISVRAYTGGPGAYTAAAYQQLKGGKQTFMASDTFTVV